MDVNSINNEIINLNQSSPAIIHKNEQNSDIKKVSKDDALNLSISDIYNKKRDELSYSLQTLNEGVAINQISKKGLAQQQEQLVNVQDRLNEAKNNVEKGFDKNDLKEDISKNLIEFNNIAQNTTYKNEKLLTVEKDDEKTVTISTQQSVYTLEKPETKEVLSALAQNLESNDFSNEEDLTKALIDTNTASKQIDSFILRVDDTDQRMVNNAKNTIGEQIDLSKENSSLRDIDFGAEVADFSKTNINSHLGFLAGTQANIVQEQSIRLLSK